MAVSFNAGAASNKQLVSLGNNRLVTHYKQRNRRAAVTRPCAVSVLSGAPPAAADSSTISISPAALPTHEQPPPVTSHRWGDGSGLSVEQFKAALQSLPMQEHVQWKSLYPAIGEGARGKVYEAVNLRTGGLLAVKVIPLADHLGSSREAALRREALVLELTAMQDHQHPNLLAMKGFHFRSSSSHPRLEIYSELGCCLEDIMPREGQPLLGLPLVQKVMAALLAALDFLHSRGVVHRDVKPGNIVSVGSSGTFKLIDMDSMFFVENHTQPQQQQCVQQQQHRVMGEPAPQSISAHIAGRAVARVAAATLSTATDPLEALEQSQPQQQQQQPSQPAQQQKQKQCRLTGGLYSSEYSIYVSSDTHYHNSHHKQQQQQGAATQPHPPQQQQYVELNALSYAGTPENMAPEVAPVVLEPSVVLWECLPLRPGRQVARGTAVAPAQDIWGSGTVMWELIMGRSLFDDFDSPEALFQHFEGLKCSSQLPAMPVGRCCADAVAVLGACLQVDPAKRPTARQLLDMKFFANVY